MGGRGNLRHLLDAVYRALRKCGIANPEQLSPWSFPSIGEHASLLEAHGLEVTSRCCSIEPTILEGGERGLKRGSKCSAGFAIVRSRRSSAKNSSAWYELRRSRAVSQWGVDDRLSTAAPGLGENFEDRAEDVRGIDFAANLTARTTAKLPPLPREFYDRDPITSAAELLGKLLIRREGRKLLAGRIVEDEAYLGDKRSCRARDTPGSRRAMLSYSVRPVMPTCTSSTATTIA